MKLSEKHLLKKRNKKNLAHFKLNPDNSSLILPMHGIVSTYGYYDEIYKKQELTTTANGNKVQVITRAQVTPEAALAHQEIPDSAFQAVSATWFTSADKAWLRGQIRN